MAIKNSVVLAFVILLEVIGNTCVSRGMRQMGAIEWNSLAPGAVAGMVAHIFSNLWVVVGVVFLLGYFLFYLTALARMDLSYVLPMTASSYVLTSILAWQILGEQVSLSRWIGTFLIGIGVLLVGRSSVAAKARS